MGVLLLWVSVYLCEIYRQGNAVIEQDYTILCGA